jgi:hypothetical protein
MILASLKLIQRRKVADPELDSLLKYKGKYHIIEQK